MEYYRNQNLIQTFNNLIFNSFGTFIKIKFNVSLKCLVLKINLQGQAFNFYNPYNDLQLLQHFANNPCQKILYAIQGTGNGHISRAREIVPLLQQYGEVDLLVSGTEAEVVLSQPLKYKFHGFSFVFGTHGGVDNWATFKLMNLPRLWRDIHSLPLKDYDLIINDFEPVSAWACRLQKIPSVSLSHQCSFISPKTPRPANRSWAEWLFKYYSPTTYHVGFHFARYDDFIHTPVIRSEIRNMKTANLGHNTVYLLLTTISC